MQNNTKGASGKPYDQQQHQQQPSQQQHAKAYISDVEDWQTSGAKGGACDSGFEVLGFWLLGFFSVEMHSKGLQFEIGIAKRYEA